MLLKHQKSLGQLFLKTRLMGDLHKKNGKKDDKLGLSCAKLSAALTSFQLAMAVY